MRTGMRGGMRAGMRGEAGAAARRDSRAFALRAFTLPAFTLPAFTLIEILMSLMVLAIGLASVLSVFVVGVRASRDVVDESAAAVAAKVALARVLSEDELPDPPDGKRDFLEIIELARNADRDWVWLHDKTNTYSGTVGGEDEAQIPDPVPVAQGSRYGWRGRASRYRGDPARPTKDLEKDGDGTATYVPLAKGRIPEGTDPDTNVPYWKDSTRPNNPDNDELWRLTIQVFRDYRPGERALAEFDTFVCTAHR